MDTQKIHTLLSVLVIAVGVLLMTFMIFAESEPGAVPLLLITGGVGWYVVTQVRVRSRHE